MGHKLGANAASDKGSTALWLLLGGAAGVGIYFLAKELTKSGIPAAHRTEVMPIPPVQTPTAFVNFDAVKTRYDQLRDLYHMGPAYKSGPEAIAELNKLQSAARQFADGRAVSQSTADALIADMEDFKNKIKDFLQFQESLKPQPAIAVSGRIRRN